MSARTCRCGHTHDHPDVEKVPRYTTGRWLAILFGISAEPVRVELTCKTCGQVLGVITDPEELRKHA